ncbi:hypothetical protein FRB94_014650 [Tulasnella sp. JGI-2019a]|nr:hypothetical protein FRB93_002461 [Tulasnella sp. JGI-2019a]KAG9007082.1 hypothetical protein FRB94_014650 [Tulasnella sp. JGI-2019a]KAG9033188.1 hypothetical protein FRB95_000443 [Tulasnella sp. JGI-2019a]
MSISTSLLATARSSYRQLWRASAQTFAGDDRVLEAFRQKARDEFIKGRVVTDTRQYEERVKLAQEVAVVIRQNLAQAEKVSEKEDTWAIRMTKDIELGSNESLKNPKPMATGSKRRKCCSEEETPMPATLFDDDGQPQSDEDEISDEDDASDLESDDSDECDYHNDVQHNHSRHTNDLIADTSGHSGLSGQARKRFKSRAELIQAHKQRVIPELHEEDLEEMFVRGSGPGGQATNKTSNNVSLIHKPTGIRVTCHKTRSQATNRRSARKMLLEKLDQLYNPGITKEDIKISKKRDQKRQKAKKARKKQQKRAEESQAEIQPIV